MKRIFPSSDSIRNFFRRRQSSREQTRQQRGSIMALMSVMILVMVGMLGLAIDLGYLFRSRTQLQNGINAAALAGAAGLRVTIEADPQASEQKKIAETLAGRYGSLNQVRLAGNPDPSNLKIDPGDVTVNTATDIPTVRVDKVIETETLFAGAFVPGLNIAKIAATATASVFPVDGGTGTMMAGGSLGGGCWRPLFLPDTFYNASNNPVIVGPDASGSGLIRVPIENGDYYRSRFAGGARNTSPFVDSLLGLGPLVTGLRDTQLQAETGTATIMGHGVTFDPNFYFIPDFSELQRVRFDVLSVHDLAFDGFCGNIRVGDDIKVYPITDLTKHAEVRQGLLDHLTARGETVDILNDGLFRYIASSPTSDPNIHRAIIPVLLYNPVIWKDPDSARATTRLTVTNIGLFFLREVLPTGELKGYFVREIIAGGTPVEAANMGVESDGFRRRYLPMAVRLLK